MVGTSEGAVYRIFPRCLRFSWDAARLLLFSETVTRSSTPYLLAAALIATLVGCGAGSQDPAPVADAGTSVGPRDGAADVTGTSTATCPGAPDFSSAAACNTVVNDATAVAFTAGAGSAPTFTGGTIVDGVYHAAKAEAWGASTGTGRRMTIVVLEGGTKFYYSGEVLTEQGGVGTTIVATTSASTVGNQLKQTTLCLTGSAQIPDAESYTATSSELVLSITQGSVVSVTTYARVGCP